MFEQILQTLTLDNSFLTKGDIDAGSGNLLLQLGLALLAGSLFYIRSITEWFRGDKKENVAETYSAPATRSEVVVEMAKKKSKSTKTKARKSAKAKARSQKPAKTSTRRRAS